MESPTKKPPQGADDIDLGPILNKIGRALNSANEKANLGWRKLVGRKYLIAVCCLIGIALGILVYVLIPPKYEASITLTAKLVPLHFFAERVNGLDALAKEGSTKRLSAELGITNAVAEKISDFKIDQVGSTQDSLLNSIPFRITVGARSNDIYDELQPAIITYLENNEYSTKRRTVATNHLLALKQQLLVEMSELDSLKELMAQNIAPRASAGGFIFGEPLDPLNVYREKLALYERLLKTENELKYVNNIELVNGFLPKGKPASPKLFQLVGYAFLITLVLGILIALALPLSGKNRDTKVEVM